MRLVIVESPTKSRTIQKFLGSDFRVLACYGHIRDLPKSSFGVDIENNFQPRYVIPKKSKKVIKILKEAVKQSDLTILATDQDREGEAIAWHLSQVLDLNGKPYQRIVFDEITKSAIEKALKNPRKIDMNLVNAQRARRILDRIVGYKLSPFLWKKVIRGLSAGRVQSVAVRLVVEREREIESFIPQEYWQIIALFEKSKKQFEALLIKKDGKTIPKLGIKTQEEAKQIIKELQKEKFKIIKIEKKELKRNPPPPFTTSTLQQEAWQRLKFPAKFTMKIAQDLYEKGFITYHRTDSLNLSTLSLNAAKIVINEKFGKDYWKGFRRYKAKGRTQEAHEAIRPTYPDKEPEKLKIKAKLDTPHFRLYDLVWRRFIASQMVPAVFDSETIDIKAKNYIFRSSGQTLKFEGYLKIWPQKFKETQLPLLKKGEILEAKKLKANQHFTQPPGRFSEATLIKELEKNGIGRPSTYAPILSTIQERNYVQKNKEKKFQPTEIGIIVNDLLVKHFPEIVDIKFTAKMEEDLDQIAQGKKDWVKVLNDFYRPFEKRLEEKEKSVSKEILIEPTEKKCPECNAPLVIRMGKFGKFYACSNFPKCRYTAPLPPPSLGIKCPKCKEGEIVKRKTKKGKIFYSCSRWPECDFALWNKPTGEICPKCGSVMVETKKGEVKCSNQKCGYLEKKIN